MIGRFSLALLLSAACAPYTIGSQAIPNPFSACQLQVAPVSFQGLRVGAQPETQWLDKKGPEEALSYQSDKTRVNEIFRAELMAKQPGVVRTDKAPFIVQARFVAWEPGYYTGFASRASEAEFVVRIVDPRDLVQDSFSFTTRIAATRNNPSAGGRMHSAGKQAAAIVAQYLATRLHCVK